MPNIFQNDLIIFVSPAVYVCSSCAPSWGIAGVSNNGHRQWLAILVVVWWCLIVVTVFFCHFTHVYWLCRRMSFEVSYSFIYWGVFLIFIDLKVWRVWYTWWKYLFPICSLPSYLLIVSWWASVLILVLSDLLFVSSMAFFVFYFFILFRKTFLPLR